MRSVRDLAKLRENVESRIARLSILTSTISAPYSPEERRAIAYCIVELDNLVINFLRSLTLSVLIGCRAVNGHLIVSTCSAANSGEAGAVMLSILNSKRHSDLGSPLAVPEDQIPAFRLPTEAEKVFSAVGASNLTNLQLGSGLNGRVFSEAKLLRHFFSHRCMSTNEKVRAFGQSIGVFNYEDAERLALTSRPGTGTPLIVGWYDDLQDFCALSL